MGVTNRLMPRWMEIKTEKSKPADLFKSIECFSMIFVSVSEYCLGFIFVLLKNKYSKSNISLE